MSERASSAGRSSQGGERLAGGGGGLRPRRRGLILFGVLALLSLGALVYGLWQGPVRVSHVVVYGADQSLAAVAVAAMQGSYLGSIPRNSTFFVPESQIRSLILAAHPSIAAVSIFRNGFTGLSIKVDDRVPAARWCGGLDVPSVATSSPSPIVSPNTDCYLFDTSGFIYATTSSASLATSSSPFVSTVNDVSPLNSFIVYEPLANEQDPIGSTLPNAVALPAAFGFARQLTSFGSPVVKIVFRKDDEVDDILSSGTRITYVLGSEENVFTALASARTNFNLADGSTDYVDLRFPGKVYLKRK
ncbi:MAG: cell division protein FtsQ/DivIB [Minisyncoccota bacterium]